MYKVTWDKDVNGVRLHSRIVEGVLGTSPRPVFYEELDLLGLDKLGWKYPHCEEPLLWAINKQYWFSKPRELTFMMRLPSFCNQLVSNWCWNLSMLIPCWNATRIRCFSWKVRRLSLFTRHTNNMPVLVKPYRLHLLTH